MKINKSSVAFSSIVGIGEKVKKASAAEGVEYLALNRGVNAVVNINLDNAEFLIDHNSTEYQTYAPNSGLLSLRKVIMKEYFPSLPVMNCHNITIMPGGMPGLDLIIQTLDVKAFMFPKFYWGSYSKMATIREQAYGVYDDILTIDPKYCNSDHCIFVCDPNNPTGIKIDDELLYKKLEALSETGAVIVFDCPYRKLFNFSMDLFDRVAQLPNVIVCESFSKSLGISGSRLGFIYSDDDEFNAELAKRALYEFNGVCTPSQLLVQRLLLSCMNDVLVFRSITTGHILKNIDYLAHNGLLATEIYGDSKPHGMFAIVNLTEDQLFEYKIGAVGLDKFTNEKEKYAKYSRICVSVPHNKFVEFFNKIVNDRV